MLLRKLEAYGFKSFAEKTEIEFKAGITAIVGPNGSGKSNISDAVRWVLGEQNIRNLRGTKTEDVIFAGSAKRRPLGVAEVSLVFDNSDGVLPLDFNEVTITRRVFRSGDAEYYINKSSCRLKDIHDLLVEAGLGRESMTVISQNKVDEVLNSKPEERRLLFEEAAGIMKYKNRKKEALRKLEDTEQNLTRVNDITSEIENQLGPLEESAARTARYNELAAEQTACQVTLLLDKLSNAEKSLEAVTQERTAFSEEVINVSTRLSLAETEKERFTDQVIEMDAKLKEVEEALNQVSTEYERLEGKTGILTERIGQENRNKERFSQDIARLETDRAETNAQVDKLQSELVIKRTQADELDKVLAAQTSELQEASSSIAVLEQQIDSAKEQTFGHLQELVTQRNALRTLERDLEAQKRREAELVREKTQYGEQLAQTTATLQELTKERSAQDEKLLTTDADMAKLQQQKAEVEAELARITADGARIAVEISELSSRLKVLTSMQNDYEGFGRGAKSVLKSAAPWRKTVCGAVAQVINVPDKFVTAVEIALGGALQHIIVENDETAKAAIAFLKQQNLGRTTFLPLNTLRPSRPRDAELAAAKAAGAFGLAAALVECEPRFRPVVDFLLGRTVVAENIDTALKIAKQQGFGVRIVTLDGDIINPGGSLTGGSTGKRESSFLGRGNEIANIKDTIGALEEKQIKQRQLAGASQRAVTDLDGKLTGLYNQRKAIEVRQAELAVHAEKTALDVRRLEMAVATLTAEQSGSAKDTQTMLTKMSEVSTTIAALENRDTEHKRLTADWQEKLKQLLAARDAVNSALTDTKIKLSSLRQEINAITANCEQYRQAEARLRAQIDGLKNEQIKVDAEIEQANREIAAIAVQKENLATAKTEREQERNALLADKFGLLAKQQKLEREIKDLRRRQSAIQSRLHEIELLAAKHGYEVNYCNEQLSDQYLLTREEAQALYREEAPAALAARISELEAEIASLGPVNPAAIEEYSRTKERYEFLRTQYLDLTAARDYLATIIKDIDTTMARSFRIAFHQINEHFGDLFVRMFGGGKAQLELMDPDNILTSGIEIIVQPPGKKQQNLTLLSGGERALTVIALLFAFLTYRPTPFCVLDEIDAALDEANVQRFSDFLRDFSHNTQFVVVTHRKGTMEAADVMHGVTMEESGVSKLISVKFMDKAG